MGCTCGTTQWLDIFYRKRIAEIIAKKKRVSYLHRTATTTYPCSIPRLGESVGAGRVRLTRAQKYKKNVSLQKKKNKCERKLLAYVPYSL